MKYTVTDGVLTGYFGFEYDQAERTDGGEDTLQFYTSADRQIADDNPPREVYEALKAFLPAHFPSIQIGAAESLHIIDCPAAEHAITMQRIRAVMLAAGWEEMLP